MRRSTIGMAFFILVSFTFPPFTGGAMASPETWNFTRSDYGRLLARGGALRFEQDSAWFPALFRKNLRVTLEHVLDPKLQPASSHGVNLKDFFHGHVGCEKPNKLARDVKRAIFALSDEAFSAEGLQNVVKPDAGNLSRYIGAVKGSEVRTGSFLKKILDDGACPRPVLVYHTFEMNKPNSMSVSDPRRNILTKTSDMHPAHFVPPQADEASSWDQMFDDIMQFVFLIDRRGVIHVTFGWTRELSRVTGLPVSD